MIRIKKWSLLIAVAMAFNLLAYPMSAGATMLEDTVQAMEENSIQTSSTESKLDKAVTGPKLSVLEVKGEVIQSDGTYVDTHKPLIQDPSNDIGFNPDTLTYALYLRSIDTQDIYVYVRHNDTTPLSIAIGGEAATSVPTFEQYAVPIKLAAQADQEITIAVEKGNETTTYTIKVHQPQIATEDPHIFAELEINPVKEDLELGIYVMNVDVNSFETTIKIYDFAADTDTDTAFSTFSANDGKAFTDDLSINLAKTETNFTQHDDRFTVSDMRSNGQFITFTVDVKPGKGIVSFGAKPEKILSVHVKRNTKYVGDITAEINTLKMEQVEEADSIYGNSLSSKFYGDINDTYASIKEEDLKTLSYLVFNGKEANVKMYVSYDANKTGRVSFEILDVSDALKDPISVTKGVLNDKSEIQTKIIQSTYKLRVLADGYVVAESEDIVYQGEQPTDMIANFVMTPVRLLEGDLDNNKVINGEDRTKLLTVLNKKVAIAGSGYVTIAAEKIYADYNNDNRINALDLGRLVQNIAKTYGAITAEKMYKPTV